MTITPIDKIELGYINEHVEGLQLRNGDALWRGVNGYAVPVRLIRRIAPGVELAVEWRTDNGMIYTDIDGKEIKHDHHEDTQTANLW